ncbi:MAG: Rrf2 family transcriptional regulator [Candidatus Didemnitutus sp.]|nr:Rrf2 family transcriptional regulator [Candidatus Didemnitutus sp.]
MKIPVKLDYTCRILCELARCYDGGEPVRIDDLSEVESVPANFLAQILGELKNAKLVVSRRGVQGGFLLARAPDQITLFDIVQAIEGDLMELSGNFDGKSGRRMKQIWNEIRGVAVERARAQTLDKMAAKTEVEMYYI